MGARRVFFKAGKKNGAWKVKLWGKGFLKK